MRPLISARSKISKFWRRVAAYWVIGAFSVAPSMAQTLAVFPPGQFIIAGNRGVCGPVPTVIMENLPDAAMFNGQAILINPAAWSSLPAVLQFYLYGHECGHVMVGADEVAADCWSVRTGRAQGWFPPQAFAYLEQLLRNNPGDVRHPPGPNRLEYMARCYAQP